MKFVQTKAMDCLYIPSTELTPEVKFESEELKFYIHGDCELDTESSFFSEIESFLLDLEQEKPLLIAFDFRLGSFCKNSKRKLLFLLQLVKTIGIRTGAKIDIRWGIHPNNAELLLTLAENYEYMTGLKINTFSLESSAKEEKVAYSLA